MEDAELAVSPLAGSPSEHLLSRRTLVHNAAVLTAGQGLGLIAPLIVVPYIARVLGPAGWGPVLMAQALANWVWMILEFAFDLSGSREVARSRLRPESLAGVVQAVQSAKALLIVTVVPVAFVAAWLIPTLRVSPPLVVSALAYAVFRGLSPLWYFQGVERVRGAVAIDGVSRVLAALGVFWFVRRPTDGWIVLALQAIFAGGSTVWLTVRLSADVGLSFPSITEGWRMLRETFTVFACRASSGVYIQANALILGTIAPGAVGFFGGAERLIRAAINLLQPINAAVLPRVSFLQGSDTAAADRMVHRSFLVMGAIGGIMAIVAAACAPILVHVLLGAQYNAAIPLLRLMAVLPLLAAINGVLGIFWAIPFGHERGLLAAVVAAGLANVGLAIVLVPRMGAAGMAIAAVAAEVVVFGVLIAAYAKR